MYDYAIARLIFNIFDMSNKGDSNPFSCHAQFLLCTLGKREGIQRGKGKGDGIVN